MTPFGLAAIAVLAIGSVYCFTRVRPGADSGYTFDLMSIFSGILLAFALDRVAAIRDENSISNRSEWFVRCELNDNLQSLIKGDLDMLSTDAWDAMLSNNVSTLSLELQNVLFPVYHQIRCQNTESAEARDAVRRYKSSPIGNPRVRSPLIALAKLQEAKAKFNAHSLQEEIRRILSLGCWSVSERKV